MEYSLADSTSLFNILLFRLRKFITEQQFFVLRASSLTLQQWARAAYKLEYPTHQP
jgi:hypothetical protein